MAEYSHLSEPDPEFAPYVAEMMAIPQIYELEARRKRFDEFVTAMLKKSYTPGFPPDSDYRVVDHQVEVANGVKILVRNLIPVGDKTYPLMVWIHGGGWTSGSIEMDDYQLRAICVELQISILNVEYRLAPEHPHPTSLNDCYSALKWRGLEKRVYHRRPVGGGHLSAVIAHRARDDPFFQGRELTGQILQVPAVLHPNAVPEKYKRELLSYEQNKDAPQLSAESAKWLFRQLGGSPTDAEVSPLLYPSHKGLVPAVIQVCGMDPLRDEALLYERLLKDAGVKTKISVYPGVPHGFNYGFPTFKLAVKWEEDYRAGLRWLLEGAPQ
ncbi:Alpha/Beta hydrolase protein [Mycena rosella]|uniref:Alpha/Beta hydrolase protein n=1 Tax=Mycena rosella TaxID=1033263 RepID=A0AAD7D6X5_MYCRO|nr:Alpha/Beta hydrolase protein [Mycena rosella]